MGYVVPDGLMVDTEAEASQEQAVAAMTPSASYHRRHDSIEAINAIIKAKLGVDFLFEASIDKRTRYLSKACSDLPPLNSVERESIRNGISLQQWASLQHPQPN